MKKKINISLIILTNIIIFCLAKVVHAGAFGPWNIFYNYVWLLNWMVYIGVIGIFFSFIIGMVGIFTGKFKIKIYIPILFFLLIIISIVITMLSYDNFF